MKSLSKPATARIRILCLHSGCSQLRILRTGPHGMGTPHCSVSVQACLLILHGLLKRPPVAGDSRPWTPAS
ncbi:hypothetical protein BDV40DRAFT_277608, partial [Aspergillus tamarii]